MCEIVCKMEYKKVGIKAYIGVGLSEGENRYLIISTHLSLS